MIVEFRPRPLVAVLALLAALVVSGGLAAASGAPLLESYRELFRGALGGQYQVGVTLNRAVPLIFVALSFIVGVRAGELNVGIEGQLYMGALAATAVGTALSAPAIVHLPLAILAGAAGGVVWVLVPAALKLWRDVSEIVSGLLLNYVAVFFTSFMLAGPMRDPTQTYAESYRIQPTAVLPPLAHGLNIGSSFAIALLVAIALFITLRNTVFGFEMRTLGGNRRTATLVGIRDRRVALYSFILSGALGGLAGAVEILGNQFRFIQNFSPGWGYTGIIVALLGGVSPLGSVVSGFAFAVLESGSAQVQRVFGIPSALSLVIEGAAVLIYLAASQINIRLPALRRGGATPQVGESVSEGGAGG